MIFSAIVGKASVIHILPSFWQLAPCSIVDHRPLGPKAPDISSRYGGKKGAIDNRQWN
jgi:hypothetical protein